MEIENKKTLFILSGKSSVGNDSFGFEATANRYWLTPLPAVWA